MALSMKELFEVVDRMDSEGFAGFFTEEANFRFGNAPTVTGKQGIREAVGGFFSAIGGLRHEILDVWDEDGVVLAEVEATYRRLDGSEVILPAAAVARLDDGLIRDYRIYMDVNPVFETSES